MKSEKEKQLEIQLLTEKIQRISGKKVVLSIDILKESSNNNSTFQDLKNYEIKGNFQDDRIFFNKVIKFCENENNSDEEKAELIDKYDIAMGETPDKLSPEEKIIKFLKDATEGEVFEESLNSGLTVLKENIFDYHEIGESLTVPRNLTTDPANKQGQTGKFIQKVDDNTIKLKFEDGTTSDYDSSIWESISDEKIDKMVEILHNHEIDTLSFSDSDLENLYKAMIEFKKI